MSFTSAHPYQPTRNYYIGSEARFEDLLAADHLPPNYDLSGKSLPHKRSERDFIFSFKNEATTASVGSPSKKAVPCVPSLCLHDRHRPTEQLAPEQLLFFHSDTPRGPPPPLFDGHNRAPQGTLRRLASVTAPQQRQHASLSTPGATPTLPKNTWPQSPDTPRPHCPPLPSSLSSSSSPSIHHSISSPPSSLVPLSTTSVARAQRVVSGVVPTSSEQNLRLSPRESSAGEQCTEQQHLLPIRLKPMRSNSLLG